MISVKGYAASSAGAPLSPFSFERREPGDHDVLIDIRFCGICHSDIHQARNEWGGGMYPMVPGHEIAGVVAKVGRNVKRFKPGDHAGVGCFVDSCRTCAACRKGLEVYCEKEPLWTYNQPEKSGSGYTFGGYSTRIVADENYVLKIPTSLPLDSAAPLLCAGITTYSPLRHWKVKKGMTVAVAGLGGLGHMAVKLAAAMGARVAVLSTSPSKEADARRLGARDFILTRPTEALAAFAGRFDLILDTISADHDVNALLSLLKFQGTLVLVGAPPKPLGIAPFSIISGRRSLSGSLVGGIAETQEMLNFCARHKITCDIEVIPASRINEAYERTLRADVRYRFVIDAATF